MAAEDGNTLATIFIISSIVVGIMVLLVTSFVGYHLVIFIHYFKQMSKNIPNWKDGWILKFETISSPKPQRKITRKPTKK